MKISKQFGIMLDQARYEMKFSQELMAELCDGNPRHYSDLEAGKVNLRLITAVTISKQTGISLDSLQPKPEEVTL